MITGTETGEGSGLLVEWGVCEYVGSSAHTGSADEEWEISAAGEISGYERASAGP
jgi:hypothetical protein